ncbi:MAG: TerC family protein [Alphaproteobacteria bacterium]|nr:TerC family protein [Alphaproteobacteria bacterium]MBV9692123.1 TerC family protein [Alphaproteobacteria bacterium]
MLNLIFSADAWVALLTLIVLEVVLGIDNIIFLSLAANKLPAPRRPTARRIGLSLALVMRVILLSSIAWIISLSHPVLTVWGMGFSWKDIVFFAGGLFLLTKSTREIHGMVEGEEHAHTGAGATMLSVVIQIAMFDIVFSVDSVVTAVGMVEQLPVMIAAVVLAMVVMMFASGPVADFVERHPTVKMLALSFLLLIGTSLVADAAHFHIPRGYLYFAVAFSGLVEFLNQRVAGNKAGVEGKKNRR